MPLLSTYIRGNLCHSSPVVQQCYETYIPREILTYCLRISKYGKNQGTRDDYRNHLLPN